MNLDLGLRPYAQVSPQLNLAPQLLNWLRLLQCPTTELSAVVRRELESNPALELDSDSPPADAEVREDADGLAEAGALEATAPSAADRELDAKIEFLSQIENEWRYESQNLRRLDATRDSDLSERQRLLMDSLVDPASLQQHLLQQMAGFGLSSRKARLVELIIGSLDDRGYLDSDFESLAKLSGRSEGEVKAALAVVQQMDPAGVGARDLRECLLLQADGTKPAQRLAARILRESFDLLARQAFDEIAAALQADLELVWQAFDYIRSLDPSPGSSFTARPVDYVSPDITLRRVDGEWVITLDDEHLPRLRLSASCRELIAQKRLTPEERAYVRGKMRMASFLIQGLGQRQQTLRKVAQEILRVQKDYFDNPNGRLKPLTMAKVASLIGVHETTVSRALAGKYIDTPYGVFEMKYFFKSGYLCNDGSALTPEAVKEIMDEVIRGESRDRPLTDLEIARILKDRGLHLARRTIAKYRDEMGIPISKDRRVGLRHVGGAKIRRDAAPAGVPAAATA